MNLSHSQPAQNQLLSSVLKMLDDGKAENIVTIDLNEKSTMADYMVIATGRSSRHVVAMAEIVARYLKQEHGRVTKIEGKSAGDWALLDAGDVVVHLFRPEVRDHYRLEKMWSPPNAFILAPEQSPGQNPDQNPELNPELNPRVS